MDNAKALGRLQTKLMKQGALSYGEQSLLITIALQSDELREHVRLLKYFNGVMWVGMIGRKKWNLLHGRAAKLQNSLKTLLER